MLQKLYFFYYETLWELKWELKSAKGFIANKKEEDGFPEKKITFEN